MIPQETKETQISSFNDFLFQWRWGNPDDVLITIDCVCWKAVEAGLEGCACFHFK